MAKIIVSKTPFRIKEVTVIRNTVFIGDDDFEEYKEIEFSGIEAVVLRDILTWLINNEMETYANV